MKKLVDNKCIFKENNYVLLCKSKTNKYKGAIKLKKKF